MVLMVVLFAPVVLGSELTISVGPVMRPVPKFVQSLTDAQYKCWAAWQNRQAEAKRANAQLSMPEKPYTTVQRTISTITGVNSGLGRLRHSGRGGMFDVTATTEKGPYTYANPQYAPMPGAIILNPFARVRGGVGSPDWGSLFMPFEGEVMTVSEAMDKFGGPVNPEALFAEGMKPYFPE